MAITHLSPLVITGPIYSDTTKTATIHVFGNWMFSPGCGCCLATVVGCCDPDFLPPTGLLTYTIEGLEPATLIMNQLGTGYTSEDYECFVQIDTKLIIQASIACFGDYWAVSFAISVYIYFNEFEALLANWIGWSYRIPFNGNGAAFGTTSPTTHIDGTGRVVCVPCFLLELSGNNTDGSFTASDNPQICGGVSYPFGPVNSVGLDLRMSANCDNIECVSNPDEVMPSRLQVQATVCDIVTPLPNIVYQEIAGGDFAWLWAADIDHLEEINGCVDSSAATHTNCFQAVQFGCGSSPGSWPGLSLGMYNSAGLFSPKGSSGYSLTNTSPFDITYEFSLIDSADISGSGCCGNPTKKIYIRIYEA